MVSMLSQRATKVAAQPPRGQKQHNITADYVPRYISKTRLCSFYLSGSCARGGSCTFAHGKQELKVKTDFSRTQLCANGASCEDSNCAFAHDASELRALAPEDLSTLTMPQKHTSHKRSPIAANPEQMPQAELLRQLQDSLLWPADDPALPMKVVSAELLSFKCTREESLSSRWDTSEPRQVQIPDHIASFQTFALLAAKSLTLSL